MALFTVGPDLVEREFIGRRGDIQRILVQMRAGKGWCFSAEPRQTGKSWLYKLALRKASASGVPGAFLDLWACSSAQELCEGWVRQICESVARIKKGRRSPADIVARHFPRLMAEETRRSGLLFRWAPREDQARAVLWEIVAQTAGLARAERIRPPAIVIDEFQDLGLILAGSLAAARVYQKLRAVLQGLKSCSFYFLGSKKSVMESIFQSEGGAFYLAATHIKPSPIDADLWKVLIADSLREHGIRIDEAGLEKILEATAGHPAYTKILCNEIYAAAAIGRMKAVTLAAVEQARARLIAGLDPLLGDRWGGLSVKERRFLRAIVSSAGDRRYGADFLSTAQLTASDVGWCETHLVKNGVLDENSVGALEFTDPMFRDWIAFRDAASA